MDMKIVDPIKSNINLTDDNCIYIINNVIDLENNYTFEISGNNCVLRFTEKGQITNATVILDHVYVDAHPTSHIFHSITNVDGNDIILTNETVYVDWFHFANSTDDTQSLQLCINIASNNGNKIQLLPKIYIVSSTLNIYSGTVIEGTIKGTSNGTDVFGSRIETELDNNTCVFMFITPKGSNFKTTCNRFKLSNFAIAKQIGLQKEYLHCSALKFDSDESYDTPRTGEVSSMYITGFEKAIEIKALSYVKFNDINIDTCKNGIVISKEGGKTLEFGWFHRIIINNGLLSADTKVEGITINNGNNLYFEEIDINDCNIGFNFTAKSDLFVIFVNRVNAIRCNTCIQFDMEQSYITRVKMSEITLGYGACSRASDTQAISDMYHGLLFKRSGDYVISWCTFTDIYDTYTVENSRSIKIEEISLNTCNFERIRILNPMEGVSKVQKLRLFTFKPYGEITSPAITTSDDPLDLGQFVVRTETKELYDGILFTEPISLTPIVTPIGDSPIPSSVTVFNDYEANKTKMSITIGGEDNKTYKYQYFFPTMI